MSDAVPTTVEVRSKIVEALEATRTKLDHELQSTAMEREQYQRERAALVSELNAARTAVELQKEEGDKRVQWYKVKLLEVVGHLEETEIMLEKIVDDGRLSLDASRMCRQISDYVQSMCSWREAHLADMESKESEAKNSAPQPKYRQASDISEAPSEPDASARLTPSNLTKCQWAAREPVDVVVPDTDEVGILVQDLESLSRKSSHERLPKFEDTLNEEPPSDDTNELPSAHRRVSFTDEEAKQHVHFTHTKPETDAPERPALKSSPKGSPKTSPAKVSATDQVLGDTAVGKSIDGEVLMSFTGAHAAADSYTRPLQLLGHEGDSYTGNPYRRELEAFRRGTLMEEGLNLDQMDAYRRGTVHQLSDMGSLPRGSQFSVRGSVENELFASQLMKSPSSAGFSSLSATRPSLNPYMFPEAQGRPEAPVPFDSRLSAQMDRISMSTTPTRGSIAEVMGRASIQDLSRASPSMMGRGSGASEGALSDWANRRLSAISTLGEDLNPRLKRNLIPTQTEF